MSRGDGAVTRNRGPKDPNYGGKGGGDNGARAGGGAEGKGTMTEINSRGRSSTRAPETPDATKTGNPGMPTHETPKQFK